MRVIDVTGNLLLEVYAERPSIHLVSLGVQLDDEAVPSVVVVQPAEVEPLIEALAQAAGELAEEVVQ